MYWQPSLFDGQFRHPVQPLRSQLLKWVGNKQRFAPQIIAYFPQDYRIYYEPFLGSGAVLATLHPKQAVGSDHFAPLIEIWQTLKHSPETVIQWYTQRWAAAHEGDRVAEYERIKASYNQHPNGADLLFLSRACYGGIMRFRQSDGYLSTPCGGQSPMPPATFARIVRAWHRRIAGATFEQMDYAEAMSRAQAGDLIYCDPPYSQTILYGAQTFRLETLLEHIAACKARGVAVALSLGETKRSGPPACPIALPPNLFVREVPIPCGRSMLKRFQMAGQSLAEELVTDRLLLTY